MIVAKRFNDGQDDAYHYAEGETYPREGYKPGNERMDFLVKSGYIKDDDKPGKSIKPVDG